jgi:lysophospholipase L1-like esterase
VSLVTSRRLPRALAWCVVLLTPPAFFGAVEAAVRLLDIQPSIEREAGVPAWLDRNVLAKESEWMGLLSDAPREMRNYYRTYRWDRYLFYALQPNLDVPMTDVTAPAVIRERTRWIFHTNARGFNAREVPYEKASGIFRIVTLGDSSTFGWGVDTEAIYPHLLERMLRARHPGARIEVINLGVCGYSSLQGLILLRREALNYNPDVVILSYGSNDFSRVPEPFDEVLERNSGWSGAVRAALQHSRAYQVYAGYLLGLSRKPPPAPASAPGETGSASEAPAAGVYNVGPEKSRANMIEMVKVARGHGVEPLFVSNCVPREMSEPIREAAQETQVPILLSEQLFERALQEDAPARRFGDQLLQYKGLYGPLADKFPWLAVYLTDKCHPNIIGHEIIAEALVPMIEAVPRFGIVAARERRLGQAPGPAPPAVRRTPASAGAAGPHAGSSRMNRLPWPGREMARTVPPCRCARCLTIERPRPVPPISRDRERSTR